MRRTLFAPRFSFAVVALVALGLGTVPAWAADSAAAGRKHATKANQLAAKNRCKSAVVEFTKAYESLKDPALLFNRAECYRKLDQAADALKDYEQFLAEMPEAPNRASVQARIATLRAVLAEVPAETPPGAPAPVPAAAPAAVPAPTPGAASSRPAPPIPSEEETGSEAPAGRAKKWTD